MKLKPGIKKTLVIILIVLLVIALSFGGYQVYKLINNTTKPTTVKVVDKIDKYGYSLEEDSTKLYKELYKKLKNVLNEKELNEEEYAKLVAEMLVVDFYDIDSKMSKNDVGGVQFILDDFKDNFVLEAEETVYKYVEHNVYGNRNQELPKVTAVEVTNIRDGSYNYDEIIDDKAYVVTVKVTYAKDLGYPTEVVVKMLHDDNKLKVFYMK